jgi:hypothetical protein
MSIQKKSLISTLKTTKKANVASAPVTPGSEATHVVSKRAFSKRAVVSKRAFSKRAVVSKRALSKRAVT